MPVYHVPNDQLEGEVARLERVGERIITAFADGAFVTVVTSSRDERLQEVRHIARVGGAT